MLAISRLYSFLDHRNGFNVHFLEGQKIIHDLALLHPMKGTGFAYFRDMFLGIMPINFFLKPGEMLGIYIDSEAPYFRLKIETNYSGQTRTLLLPEDFNQFPMKITGKLRLTKITPNEKAPYTSMIELKEIESKEVINHIFNEVYQTNSEVIVSEICDQAVMVTKLPPINVNVQTDLTASRKEFIKKNKEFFHHAFELATDDIEKIVKLFEDQGFAYLGSRQIDFFCGCSKDRMVVSLRSLYQGDLDDLFNEKDTVEITCDYCKKHYSISKSEVLGS